MSGVRSHWEAFYAREHPEIAGPSQFAAFVLQEFPGHRTVLDVGCGNGRDAFFFAQYGKSVLGLDGAANVIARNMARLGRNGGSNPAFRFLSLSDASQVAAFVDGTGRLSQAVVYARFLLHALSGDEEDLFLDMVDGLMGSDCVLAMEYRVPADRHRPKETPAHFRRFVDPAALGVKLGRRGLATLYHTEGTGLAKYRGDDACVARTIVARETP